MITIICLYDLKRFTFRSQHHCHLSVLQLINMLKHVTSFSYGVWNFRQLGFWVNSVFSRNVFLKNLKLYFVAYMYSIREYFMFFLIKIYKVFFCNVNRNSYSIFFTTFRIVVCFWHINVCMKWKQTLENMRALMS